VRNHVCTPARRNVVPTESHSDGQRAGYFLRTLQTLLLALGYSEPPLFVGTPRLLHAIPGSMKQNSEQITQSFFLACPNLRGEIPFKGGRPITPTFCIIKLCQARSALGGILEKCSLRLHSWHGILYFL
jgi:hypothetical protein